MRWLVLLAVLSACPAPKPPPARPRPPGPGSAEPPVASGLDVRRVETAADVPKTPAPGTYQIHMIDVGTGLAILIRGADFTLLYDAGTNDKEERPLRVAAYLAAALGPSGDDSCVDGGPAPKGRVAIDHVVLSHPHLDHASALDLVVHCYDIKQFWDSGAINSTVFYRELMSGLSRSKGTRYHTAADVPGDRTVTVKGLSVTMPDWSRFSEGDTIQLGEGAKFTILHAEGKKKGDFNENSVVIAVELGGTRVLLVGDAESGPRKAPSEPVGDVEEFLIDHHAKAIAADILQVGHHGSKTSSRRKFLEAVKPTLALVSTGPKMYGKVTLPDQEVLDALTAVGAKILRTDERDADCPVKNRIGGDRGPGGCDSWVITVGSKPAP